jgi:hypothetical protein
VLREHCRNVIEAAERLGDAQPNLGYHARMNANAPVIAALLAVLAIAGCKKAEGEPCKGGSDCKDELGCVTWDDFLEDALAPCDDTKCCIGEEREDEADRARKKAQAAAAKAKKEAGGDKTTQCNRLIRIINMEQGPMKAASGSDPAVLRNLAATLDDVAKTVRAIKLTDKKLIGFRDGYATIAVDLGKASRVTADALAANDATRAATAAKVMSSFAPRESKVIDGINKHCMQSP